MVFEAKVNLFFWKILGPFEVKGTYKPQKKIHNFRGEIKGMIF